MIRYDNNIQMEMVNGCRFVTDIPSQLAQTLQTGPFPIPLMEIDHQKEIGDQSREQLHQNPVWVSGDQVIDFEVLFPPGEKGFNLPTQRINEGDLFGRKIRSIRRDPVSFASTFEADEKRGWDIL